MRTEVPFKKQLVVAKARVQGMYRDRCDGRSLFVVFRALSKILTICKQNT